MVGIFLFKLWTVSKSLTQLERREGGRSEAFLGNNLGFYSATTQLMRPWLSHQIVQGPFELQSKCFNYELSTYDGKYLQRTEAVV